MLLCLPQQRCPPLRWLLYWLLWPGCLLLSSHPAVTNPVHLLSCLQLLRPSLRLAHRIAELAAWQKVLLGKSPAATPCGLGSMPVRVPPPPPLGSASGNLPLFRSGHLHPFSRVPFVPPCPFRRPPLLPSHRSAALANRRLPLLPRAPLSPTWPLRLSLSQRQVCLACVASGALSELKG